jgi:hypothetical protein
MSNTMITAGVVAPAVVTLTDAATIAVNASEGNDFRVSIGASRVVGAPASPVDGQRITLQITQGGGGSFSVTWDGVYIFGSAGQPTLSTPAGMTDVIGFIYNAAKGKWFCVGTALGF